MNIERKIKVPFSIRNIERMYRWLKLTPDFNGWFERDGKRVGYKMFGRGSIIFVFCK